MSGSSLNVFSRGSGVDLAFDHHKRAPFANLFTDLDLGAVFTKDASIKDPAGRWLEAISPAALTPPNLHEAQLQRRLAAAPGTAAR